MAKYKSGVKITLSQYAAAANFVFTKYTAINALTGVTTANLVFAQLFSMR